MKVDIKIFNREDSSFVASISDVDDGGNIISLLKALHIAIEENNKKSEMVELPEWTEALMPEYQESGDQDE